jgi:hypothetical protein
VVLQSKVKEPLKFIEFAFNDYATYVPIYDGQTIELSDNLTFASDGVMANEMLYYFGNDKANTVTIKNSTDYVYLVKMQVEYDVYEHMYVMTIDDINTSN